MSSLRSVTGVALGAALAVALGGCGGSAASTTRTFPVLHTGRARLRRRPDWPGERGQARRGPAPIGRTLIVNTGDGTLSVTVSGVLDPLVDSGAAPAPGTRAVGVQVTIANDAGATYDSSASGDLSVVTSSGDAAPLFIPRGACQTPLVDFESLIGVGEARSGCVGFAVPDGSRILAVRFSPHSRPPGSVAWR
ncbi:MAG: hypothetical protein ABSH51_24735 [Solirubrobacteraceae bacterium]|jgi:hypothetical protein